MRGTSGGSSASIAARLSLSSRAISSTTTRQAGRADPFERNHPESQP